MIAIALSCQTLKPLDVRLDPLPLRPAAAVRASVVQNIEHSGQVHQVLNEGNRPHERIPRVLKIPLALTVILQRLLSAVSINGISC